MDISSFPDPFTLFVLFANKLDVFPINEFPELEGLFILLLNLLNALFVNISLFNIGNKDELFIDLLSCALF